jgi:hypothetical protein
VEAGCHLAPFFFWVVFCMVVGIVVMVHAVWRLECASAATSTSAWHASSLVVVACSLVECPLTPFL